MEKTAIPITRSSGRVDDRAVPGAENDSPWQTLLSGSIEDAAGLARSLGADRTSIERVCRQYPVRITPYFLSLIRAHGEPLWRQAVPDPRELEDDTTPEDPLWEEKQSPVPGLIHRYPDTVLFSVSNRCAVYCRYCMRRRRVGKAAVVGNGTIEEGIDYIASQDTIREVVLSGGDPLLLGDDELVAIVEAVRAIAHVEVVRIHTRAPCTIPRRITTRLARELGRFHPLYVMIQFNHPAEVTPEAALACARLAEAGIPLGSQTVLLAGVNDDPACMERLMRALVRIRVRPAYVHHLDRVRGNRHFRVSIQRGRRILETLRGRVSGICMPRYVLDLPGGGGKVCLGPEDAIGRRGGHWLIRNYQGRVFGYKEESEP
ncbi:KamA family radical SAM protein [Thermodesulfobacteriota bacterium]